MSGESLHGAPRLDAVPDVFGAPVRWHPTDAIGQFANDTPLQRAVALIRKRRLAWVVVTAPPGPGLLDPLHYVVAASDLERMAADAPDLGNLMLDDALGLKRRIPAATVRAGRPLDPVGAPRDADFVVEVDAAGRVVAVGERLAVARQTTRAKPRADRAVEPGPDDRFAVDLGRPDDATATRAPPVDELFSRDHRATDDPLAAGVPARPAPAAPASDAPLDLGPTRSGRRSRSRAAAEPAATQPTPPQPPPGTGDIEITVSAEAPAELDVGASARVPFQVELAGEAMPLAVARNARAQKDVPIVVSLSAENDAIEVVRVHERTVDPPASGEPRSGFFTVKAIRAGACRLAVAFRQGGTDLAVIGLAVDVKDVGAQAGTATGRAIAAPRDVADDDKLALLVEQRVDGNQVVYEYTLHSEALGLPYRRLRSKPLLDSGGGPAATAVAFVERIYARVTRELKSLDDLQELQREARALGAGLCEELLDPEVARLLWPLRDRLRLVQIVSWEPYIPWELVRLRDPASGDIDDRFLCEYGLVRTLSDEMPARELALASWAYLGASFPMGSFPSVGAELDYFKAASPAGLASRGIEPRAIEPTRSALYKALADGDFDVLHIACHAESDHASIERSSLVIGDESRPGASRPELIEVDTVTVSAEAKLRTRRPLVFLNACESGRAGAVLTAWGGWPNVFLRRGAGAFVGTSWAVRDKPAAAFSTAFYNALIDGATLAEAASAARAAAQKFGDASWLAFKVYGHPRARRAWAAQRG